MSSPTATPDANPRFEPMTSFGPVPEGWLWGTATAAHQIEGGNTNNDWWAWEHTPGSGTQESSGDATDSWNRWREDHQLVKDLGLDAYRFSIEWSRIEPAQGEFSIAALNHYRELMTAAHELGLKNSVTFHHFTTPIWAAAQGGWLNPEIVEWFTAFVEHATAHLGDLIDIAATFNEPNVVVLAGYLGGNFPPGHHNDVEAAAVATANIVAAHKHAVPVLKAGPGEFPVGLTLAIPDMVIHPDGDPNSDGIRLTEVPTEGPEAQMYSIWLGAYLEAARDDDYMGVQTYFTQHLGPDFQDLPTPADWRVTQMDWTFTPEALGSSVRLASRLTGVPVIVTENGVATTDDAERIEYYSRALASLRHAMDDGVDVRGFFAWSLLDNFEWAEGYRPLFGLVAVDRETFQRTPKPSAAWYAGVVASSHT